MKPEVSWGFKCSTSFSFGAGPSCILLEILIKEPPQKSCFDRKHSWKSTREFFKPRVSLFPTVSVCFGILQRLAALLKQRSTISFWAEIWAKDVCWREWCAKARCYRMYISGKSFRPSRFWSWFPWQNKKEWNTISRTGWALLLQIWFSSFAFQVFPCGDCVPYVSANLQS